MLNRHQFTLRLNSVTYHLVSDNTLILGKLLGGIRTVRSDFDSTLQNNVQKQYDVAMAEHDVLK